MFEILFDGIHYRVVPIGADHLGWMTLDATRTLEEAYAKCKKDWDFFWGLRGFAPSRQLNVIFA